MDGDQIPIVIGAADLPRVQTLVADGDGVI